jgi:uncharacterized protein YbcC (UPF0753/DUF2309 family)
MTTATTRAEAPSAPRRAIDVACDRVAPTWPLDRFIAVNPYWGWRGSWIADAAAALGSLAGTALTMPTAWFRGEWAAGRLADHHLDEAATAAGEPALADLARRVLAAGPELDSPPLTRLPLVTDAVDASPAPGPVPGRTWTDLVMHQIGQRCAAHFDQSQATWPPDQQGSLFSAWRQDPSVTHGFRWRRGRDWARQRVDSLPVSPAAAISVELAELGVSGDAHEAYLTAVLASVNGWAAWCAYRRWQARLAGSDDDAIVDLLAIRVTWEWLLAADVEDELEAPTRLVSWAALWRDVDAVMVANREAQRVDWVLQSAVERTYQDGIIGGLGAAVPSHVAPEVQAVFCIDVRSEVFRRALEATGRAVHTRGFAGFFGLPISYTPAGSALTRPQLPGLLAPSLEVTDVARDPEGRAAIEHRSDVLAGRQRWEAFRHEPSSVFTFVEALGLTYAVKLVEASMPHRHRPAGWEQDGLGRAGEQLRPRLVLVDDDPAAAAAIAQRVLVGMGLTDGFAPLVLLCGHGSRSTNNPHAAGLDCGACGGQTGEVNARVIADLLNDRRLRDELRGLGIDVAPTTWFVAGLHTTTTDEVELFDVDRVPPSHRQQVGELGEWLRAAGDRARAERAPSLGLAHLVSAPQRLATAVAERANDWSQVRPEWGLAGNAAFVVAPRWRTRHLDLQGRTFLHDYDWRTDPDGAVLTSIMTAPMVVTNWINLQYHASTVDNRRYGSGNKVLHNVVGGNVGVFEGNGGDLRIGLAIQSLHDGQTLRHPPLRLSVFIESPRAPIDAVIDANAVVHDLVLNGWLNLLRIDPSDSAVEERSAEGWRPRAATAN